MQGVNETLSVSGPCKVIKFKFMLNDWRISWDLEGSMTECERPVAAFKGEKLELICHTKDAEYRYVKPLLFVVLPACYNMNTGQNLCKLWWIGQLTIAFYYHLSNCIQFLCYIDDFGLDFYNKNWNRTRCLEVIFDPAFHSYTAIKHRFWFISEGKTKFSNQPIEYLRTTVWVYSE